MIRLCHYQCDGAYGFLQHSPYITVYYSCNNRSQGSLHESCISALSLKMFFWCLIVKVKKVWGGCWIVERKCFLTSGQLERKENLLFLRLEVTQWCLVWISLVCDYTEDKEISPKVEERLYGTMMETSHHYHVSFSQVFSVKFLPKSIDSIKFCFPNILIDGWWNIFE